MSMSPHFEVKANLYFRVHDSDWYGGEGSVGYAKQSYTLNPDAKLESFDEAMAESVKESFAKMLGVPTEKLEYVSAQEYEEATDDDDDSCEEDDCDE